MPGVRATASNVTISLGLMNFPVDLVSATRSNSTRANSVSKKLICPTCTEENRVSQVYQCDKGHGPHSKGELDYAIESEGKLQRLTVEQLAELAKADEADGVRDRVELTVYPAQQVEASTLTSGNVYRLRARAQGMEAYGLLRELAGDESMAFLGEVSNKGATKLYRLVVRDGLLVLVELVRPSDIYEPEPAPCAAVAPRMVEAGRGLVLAMVEDFDPDTFADKRKVRLAALADVEAVEDRPDRAVVQVAADLMGLIQRSRAA